MIRYLLAITTALFTACTTVPHRLVSSTVSSLSTTSSPQCLYPRPALIPSNRPVNYIESPIISGSVLYGNYGQCCREVQLGIWEGILGINYTEDPVYSPLYGTNNWGTDLSLDQHEMGFIKVYRNEGIFAASRTSHVGEGRVGIGHIDLLTGQYDWDWFRPGRNEFPVGLTAEHVYTRVESSGIIHRYLRGQDGKPSGTPRRLTMGVWGGNVPPFTHVAPGRDGTLYAVYPEGAFNRIDKICIWSTRWPPDYFSKTESCFSVPDLYLFQPNLALDSDGFVLEPLTITANCSTDGTFADQDSWGMVGFGPGLPSNFDILPDGSAPITKPDHRFVLRDGNRWVAVFIATCLTPPCSLYANDNLILRTNEANAPLSINGLTFKPTWWRGELQLITDIPRWQVETTEVVLDVVGKVQIHYVTEVNLGSIVYVREQEQ